MPTTAKLPDLHTQAGLRWLASFLVVFLAAVLCGVVMLVYPYVSA